MKLLNYLKNLVSIYQKGLKYDSLSKDYMESVVEIGNLEKDLRREREQFTAVITELENENILLYDSLERTEIDSEPLFDLDNVLANLNKKIEQKPWKYAYKGDGKSIDIKYALTIEDKEVVKSHAKIINAKYSPSTPTECVEAVSKYFIYDKDPKYITDIKQFNLRDYWLPADKFLYTFRGDCDDTAIAMHNLIKELLDMNGFSKHYDRLYFCVSNTLIEAHAYNIWLADDGYFYVVESTIDRKGTFKRKWLKTPLAYDSLYYNFWGFANLNGSHKGSNALLYNYL